MSIIYILAYILATRVFGVFTTILVFSFSSFFPILQEATLSLSGYYTPKVIQTNQIKSVFSPNDTVAGNGIEFKISNYGYIKENYVSEQNLDSGYKYCYIEFNIENKSDKHLNFYEDEFKFQSKTNDKIDSEFNLPEPISKYNFKTMTIIPGDNETNYSAFICSQNSDKVIFTYDSKSYLTHFVFFNHKPIKFELNFSE
jgi:hypothetical protein